MKRARPAEAPSLSRSALRAVQEQEQSRRERETLERRSMLRGLLLLAIAVLLVALVHGGADRAFPSGWWHQW